MLEEPAAALVHEWQEKLEAVVAALLHDDGSHDLGHCRRVWRLAEQIAMQVREPADPLVLLAAAYLHDIVALEKNDPRRSQASRLAAAKAEEILTGLGFPSDKLGAVRHAIEAHSFSAQIAPLTIEAKILQDADRMETLGAVGLARVFYVGGRMGTALFHATDPLARHRPLDDLRYSLDHFHTKILKLPDQMNTEPGRIIARERTRIIEQFLACLLSEAGFDEM